MALPCCWRGWAPAWAAPGLTACCAWPTTPGRPHRGDIRLPRSLGAWLAGALLGLAGAVAQGLFRNPLADPFLLGSASGASLGVPRPWRCLAWRQPRCGWPLGLTGAAFVGAVGRAAHAATGAGRAAHPAAAAGRGDRGRGAGRRQRPHHAAAPDIIPSMQGFNLGSAGFIGWASCVLMAAAWCVCALAAWVFSRALDG